MVTWEGEKMDKKETSMEQEREKMYSMAVTLEMEEIANYREAALRKDRRENREFYRNKSTIEILRRINQISDQADEEWIKMQELNWPP